MVFVSAPSAINVVFILALFCSATSSTWAVNLATENDASQGMQPYPPLANPPPGVGGPVPPSGFNTGNGFDLNNPNNNFNNNFGNSNTNNFGNNPIPNNFGSNPNGNNFNPNNNNNNGGVNANNFNGNNGFNNNNVNFNFPTNGNCQQQLQAVPNSFFSVCTGNFNNRPFPDQNANLDAKYDFLTQMANGVCSDQCGQAVNQMLSSLDRTCQQNDKNQLTYWAVTQLNSARNWLCSRASNKLCSISQLELARQMNAVDRLFNLVTFDQNQRNLINQALSNPDALVTFVTASMDKLTNQLVNAQPQFTCTNCVSNWVEQFVAWVINALRPRLQQLNIQLNANGRNVDGSIQNLFQSTDRTCGGFFVNKQPMLTIDRSSATLSNNNQKSNSVSSSSSITFSSALVISAIGSLIVGF